MILLNSFVEVCIMVFFVKLFGLMIGDKEVREGILVVLNFCMDYVLIEC